LVRACPDLRVIQLENVADTTELRARLARTNVAALYSANDEAQIAVAELRLERGLPATDPRVLTELLQKDLIRRKLSEAGQSDVKYLDEERSRTLATLPPGRWVMKRSRGAGSLGVRMPTTDGEFERVRSQFEADELKSEIPFGGLADLMRGASWYIEESVEGDLLSVEAMVVGGETTIIGVTRPYQVDELPPRRMPGGLFPFRHELDGAIQAKVVKATRVLGFTDGPIHVEVIADNRTGKVEIIDFNPRAPGALVVPTISAASDSPMEKMLLDWACGDTPVIPKPVAAGCFRMFLSPMGQTQLVDLTLPACNAAVVATFQSKSFGASLAENGGAGSDAWVGGFVLRAGDTRTSHIEAERLLAEVVRVNGHQPREMRLIEPRFSR
jgi:hypothetical protein